MTIEIVLTEIRHSESGESLFVHGSGRRRICFGLRLHRYSLLVDKQGFRIMHSHGKGALGKERIKKITVEEEAERMALRCSVTIEYEKASGKIQSAKLIADEVTEGDWNAFLDALQRFGYPLQRIET